MLEDGKVRLCVHNLHHDPSINPLLPPEAVVQLPIALDKSVRDEVIRRVELKETEETPEVLLSRGQEPSGIHVLVSGNVTVFRENQKFVLREIQAGDCFGEVSVLFNMKCTAGVWSSNRYLSVVVRLTGP